VSTSGFTLLTSVGEKVTVKETSSTKYEKGASSASASAVTKGETALVVGTTDSTTIAAAQVIVHPTSSVSKTPSEVIPFKQGSPSASKQAGQISASYKEGSGTIVSGTTANKATKAALTACAGGVVDRVVKLSNGEYEVHNIGVNWPHHVFVRATLRVARPLLLADGWVGLASVPGGLFLALTALAQRLPRCGVALGSPRRLFSLLRARAKALGV
jgi:hypothetical protein